MAVSNTYNSTVYVVAWSAGGVVSVQDITATPEQPQTVSTGLANVEDFLSKEARDARAIELGYTFPEAPTPE